MANFVVRNGRHRALVRKAGHVRCATFATRAQARAWAVTVEREIDELKATGVMQPRGLTFADLVDRYKLELYPVRRWGRSKSADLERLKKDLGEKAVSQLSAAALKEYFRGRYQDGAGAVVVASQLGYLVGILETARTLWQLDVPLQAAKDVRTALGRIGMVGKSKRRDRRVTDAELRRVTGYLKQASTLPLSDILQFCMATGMRISEVCRITWDDLDVKNKTVVIRDRKHPQDKIGNDMVVPLLSATGYDAYAIAKRQPHDTAHIFPYNPKTVSTLFTRAAAAVEIDDLRLHDLRHEAISRLFEAGYTIEQVALMSGHRDWAMLKRYTHVRAADLHKKPQR